MQTTGDSVTGHPGGGSVTGDPGYNQPPRFPVLRLAGDHTTTGNVEMTQTHLQEECRGTGFERRGLDMSDWRGVLGFWRRMTSRLSGGLPAAAAAPAPAAGTSTRGSSTDDSR